MSRECAGEQVRSEPSGAGDSGSRDSVDALVAEAWCAVLGLPATDRHRTFLDAGGNSLHAARIVARLNAVAGITVPISAVFEAPTIDALAHAVRQAPRTGSDSPPASPSSPPCLSHAQERMWFMHALAPESAAFQNSLAVRLRGRLDVAALQRALAGTVRSHTSMRTVFPAMADRIVPQIRDRAPALARIARSSAAEPVPAERMRERLSALSAVPFDLEHGPLLRAALIDLDDDDAVLLLTAHQIAADPYSLNLFLQDLARQYAVTTGDSTQPGPAEAKDFAAFAAWHRRWVEECVRPAQLPYWRERLAGLEPLYLPTDHARTSRPSFRGARLELDVSTDDLAALEVLGAHNGCTLGVVLLAALKVLLNRHTGLADVAVGIPAANRHLAAAESLPGCLENIVVARTDLAGELAFLDLLQRVRATWLQALDHQDLPIDLLLKELNLAGDASGPPLFSVMFRMQHALPPALRFPGLELSLQHFDRGAAQIDLSMIVDVTAERPVWLEYSTALFSRTTMRVFADHYATLLQSILRNPSQSIATLPLASTEEVALLKAWSHGPLVPRPQSTLAQLLGDTSARMPDAVALAMGPERYTYRELDVASDRVAAALHARGLGRGSRVGICLPRSPRLIFALWGIIRSGAAYVPLDPSYPRERLAFMMEDARLSALVSESTVAVDAGWHERMCPLLDMDELSGLADIPVRALDPALLARPEDPAYVLYTSGSTGRPKGVVVAHGAVANFIHSMSREPGIRASDRVLAITTLGFDIAVLELLLPWTVGAQVHLASSDEALDGEWLANTLRTEGISLMQATPGTWRILIDSGWSGSPGLKALVGGETLPLGLAMELQQRCREVWNMYGPTETTVWSTCWKVESPQRTGICLGHPIANTQVFVLDPHRQLCPVGVAGEICIGGDGVALGYFAQEQLTAERFVTIAMQTGANARVYRTGDQGRWRPDGALEHLGRLDDQVKIRGYRIELGEIESRLAAHPGVQRAIVAARRLESGSTYLVAYIVPRGAMPDAATLRTFLREWLPDYMVPQAFVALDTIPLLPNGKTDRRRLPIPQFGLEPRAIVSPRTPIESALLRIWQEVLGIQSIGVHDNFFDLGGHSLLGIRLVHRIRETLQRPCALGVLFHHPTIAGLATLLDRKDAGAERQLIALQPLGTELPLYCICGIHLYQHLADELAPEVPVYGVFVPSELHYMMPGGDAPRPSVQQLAAEYLGVIRGQQPHGPYRLAGFSFGGVLAYEIAQQLVRAGETVSLVALLDSDVPNLRAHSALTRAGRLLLKCRQRLSALLRRSSGAGTANVIEARSRVIQEAMHTYAADRYAGPVVYVEASGAEHDQPGYDWRALAPDLHIYRIPGDHTDLLVPDRVRTVAEKLLRHLREPSPAG